MPGATTPSHGDIRLMLRRPGGTRLWRTAKLVLPTVATLAILVLIFWSQTNLEETRLRIGITELEPEEIDNLKMMNLRFDGMDRNDRPFSITADVASQNKDSDGVIDLFEPRADITLADGSWVALMAGDGHYDRDANNLSLGGGVSLHHDKGFEMSSDTASIDLGTGTASSNTPTAGQGPAGFFNAAGFRVENDGDRVLLQGPSRLHLYSAGEAVPEGSDGNGNATPETPEAEATTDGEGTTE